jgi:UDPglucose--hexose-1-phosphate uridylyltransferase
MSPDQVLVLVHAWTDRMEELSALADIRAVLIFENRGVEVGVTLHHPHGQLYAFDLVPPRLASERENARAAHGEGRCLFCEIVEGEVRSGVRVLWESERFLAAVPFFARYPYEVHVYARRHGCASLLDFDEGDRRELAGLLRYVAAKYDAYCEGCESPMPYMMVCHQLHEENAGFHFHVEFYPVRRSPTKLKYAASVETGGGLWLCDAYPERSVEDLRRVGPTEPALPTARVVARSRWDG